MEIQGIVKMIMEQENCSATYALYILSKIRKFLEENKNGVCI